MPVWEAVEARAHVAVERFHAASLVGRVGELALLGGALDRARRERSCQLVTLVGVPGIGKSRLVYELFRIVEADEELITWRQGPCPPYGDGVTFWALGEIVKAEAGVLESDVPEEAERKLRDAVADVRVESYLRPLVGLGAAELGGGDLRAEAFAAWRQFLETVAEQRPLVLVVEDLHWADENLLDFLDHLVDWASGVPILVVGTARPELLERRPAWGGGKSNTLTISLSALSDDETGRLIAQLLEQPLLTAETQSELLVRAGGNPLYAEQFARVLREQGEVAELPETVQGMIAARLDLLRSEEKAALQDAAVFGRSFWAGGVATVSGLDPRTVEERLHSLERRDFVRRERRTAVADDTQYAFLHALVRDVAYGQIPRAERAGKHRRAAEWLVSLGRPEDHAEMLAHHYLQALDLSHAAGLETAELVEPARLALHDAALALWPADTPERAELLYRAAIPVGRHIGGGDPERLAKARDALLAAGDGDRAAEVEMQVAQAYWIQGNREVSREHAAAAVALLGDGPPTRSRAWVLARMASRAYLNGEEARALELASQARVASERLGWEDGLSDALNLLGMIRLTAGDEGGVEDIERSVELVSASGALGTLLRVSNSLAVAHQMLGDLELGFEKRLECARWAEQLGSESLVRWYQGVLVDHRYRRGDWDEAQRDADDFLEPVEAGTPHVVAWQVFAIRAELRLARGDAAGALADAERALAAGRVNGELQALGFVLAGSAHVFALAGERERAAALARELLDSLRRGRHMGFAVINLPMLASAAVPLGLGEELVTALAGHPESRWTEALGAYVAGDFVAAAEVLARAGARPHEAEARLRAAEQLAAEGLRAEADAQLQQALDFHRSVGATRYVCEAETSPAGSA